MKSNNICKFVEESYDEALVTTRFILETELAKKGWHSILPCDAIFLVVAGRGRLTLSGTVREILVGDLFFVFPGQEILIEDLGSLQYMYIYFSGGRTFKLYAKYGIDPTNFLFHGMEGIAPLWKDSLVRADERNIDLLSESMLLYAFSRLDSDEREDVEMIRLFTEYMEAHFRENDCTLQSVAEALGYNAKYLSHRIKQKMGTNFSDYLKNLRLQYAVLLFGQGVTSVKNVAILTGFTDPLYFSKIFKQSFGLSPRDFIGRIGN